MTEWQTVLLICSILGGVWGIISGTSKIVKPLIEAITTLNFTAERLTVDLKELKTGNTEDHRRIWAHNEEQDKALNDHENRINILEHERG